MCGKNYLLCVFIVLSLWCAMVPAMAQDSLGIQRYDAVNDLSSRPRQEIEAMQRVLERSYQTEAQFMPTGGLRGAGVPSFGAFGAAQPAGVNPMAMLNQYLSSPVAQALMQEVSRNPVVGRYVNSRSIQGGVQTALRDPMIQLVMQIGLQALANEGGGMQAYQPVY